MTQPPDVVEVLARAITIALYGDGPDEIWKRTDKKKQAAWKFQRGDAKALAKALAAAGYVVVRASDGLEEICAWAILNSFATGHGDTLADVLTELSWQIAEIRSCARLTVRCVNAAGLPSGERLTVGKSYVVVRIDDDGVAVCNDNADVHPYNPERFASCRMCGRPLGADL